MQVGGRFSTFWAWRHRDTCLWLGLCAISVAYFIFHFAKYPGGAKLYQNAAQCLWDQKMLQVCDPFFTYTPTFAFVMLPAAAMPMWLLLPIWFVVTFGCAVWCCMLAEQLVVQTFQGKWPNRDRELLRIGAIFVSLKYILAVFENQGFDLLVLPAIFIGILALAQRRDVVAGLSLAAAAALKVTPLIFLPYLLFKRRFAAAAIFAAALAFFCFLPDLFFGPGGGEHGYFLTWVRDVAIAGVTDQSSAPHPFWFGANPYNLSLKGAVALALNETAYQGELQIWLRAVQLAFCIMIGALLLSSWRKELVPIDGAILIIAMLMLSPMSSRDHFVALLLPYYLIVAGLLRGQRSASIGLACLVLSFILTGIPREIVPRAYSEFMRMHSDTVYGTIILLIYLGLMLRKPFRWGIPTSSK